MNVPRYIKNKVRLFNVTVKAATLSCCPGRTKRQRFPSQPLNKCFVRLSAVMRPAVPPQHRYTAEAHPPEGGLSAVYREHKGTQRHWRQLRFNIKEIIYNYHRRLPLDKIVLKQQWCKVSVFKYKSEVL